MTGPPTHFAFIVSAGRTGTMFFGQTLARLIEDVYAVHEPDVLHWLPYEDWRTRLTNWAVKIRTFGFYHMVLGRLAGRTGIRCLSQHYLAGRLTDQAVVTSILQQRSGCYRAVQSSYVIESNYQWYGLLGPLRQALPHCKIALITRDPRTWVPSRISSGAHVYQDAAERLGHQRVNPRVIGDPVYAHQWERMTPFEKACWDWQFINGLIKAHAARDPEARLFRYEDLFLSAERQHHVAELLAFLTTFPDRNYAYRIEPALFDQRVNTAATTRFPHWTEWPPAQARALQRICGPLMPAFGYGEEAEWQAKLG